MWTKLDDVEKRFEELGAELSKTEVATNPALLQKYSKERKGLTQLVDTYREYRKLKEQYVGSNEMYDSGEDAQLAQMAREEMAELEPQITEYEEKLRVLLLPKDPNDDKNVIIEIRAGAGGDEASIFAGELFRMFVRYAEGRKWRVETLSASEGSVSGYKEIIGMISGEGAYSRFKFERGVHRVQRVPQTETQGRIHTSTVTVAVLPEAEDVEIEVLDKDLRIDVYRSSGPGGQSVNTTDSAVRITHIPTGIVVAMQDEKSQHKNKDKALRVLKARLLDAQVEAQRSERQQDRRSQVGTGDRSEKIRTYNFPQSRVTDHRIGLTLHSLSQVMDGDLDQVIDPLTAHFQSESLKGELGA